MISRSGRLIEQYHGRVFTGSGHLSADGSIWNVQVPENLRGKGYGAILMHRILEEAKRDGHESVWLKVYAWNYVAIRLYAKLGFKAEGITYSRGYADYKRPWTLLPRANLVMRLVLSEYRRRCP